MNPLESHPNATRASGGAGAGVIAVWLAGYLGLSLTAEEGALVAGVAASALVFIGNDGVVGAVKRLLFGKPAPAPPVKVLRGKKVVKP